MKILYSYIKKYKGILFLALILAAINQSFSLCDSIITGKLLNKLGVNLKDYNNDKFWFMKDLAFFLSLSAVFKSLLMSSTMLCRSNFSK